MAIAVKDKAKRKMRLKRREKMIALDPPPLENGEKLSRVEFVRRYEAMPNLKKAELIEGVVYMPSPVRIEHSRAHAYIIGWLVFYCSVTPNIDLGDNATLRLDVDNEPQPDVFLRLETASGGASRISDDHYLEGAPELIVEIAASSASYDLRDKKKVYRRNGVQEYLVWRVYDEALDWFQLQEGEYHRLEPGEDGLTCVERSRSIRSQVFPGLHLDVEALLAGDTSTTLSTGLSAVLSAVRAGTETEEHAAFVEGLTQPKTQNSKFKT